MDASSSSISPTSARGSSGPPLVLGSRMAMAASRSPSRTFISFTPEVSRPVRSEIVSMAVRTTMPPAEIIISSS